jgi:hypothetical protein
MTGQQTLTYMAADIIGYSLLTQKDQRKAFELIETYQSILLPLIKNEGGSSIVCTADAITACFSSCLSAIRAGFAIQKALAAWNKSSSTLKLSTRIGIHASSPDDKGHLQQLSKTVAKSLESLGNAKALSVSLPVLKGIENETLFHCYPLGGCDLDYLPEPLSVFFLYEKKPGFFTRLCLQARYLKIACVNRHIVAYSLTVATSVMLFVAVLFFNTSANSTRIIEFSNIVNLSGDAYKNDINALSLRIKSRLEEVSGVRALNAKVSYQAATQLVCSFQKSGDDVRLTWGFLDQGGEVQISGGEVSGNIGDLEDLEMRLIDNIISQIEISNS